jgi:hypothetical protein
MQSMKTLKEADPHDVFAIETILATRGDRAPPLAHDAVGHPGGPQGAPEISIGAPAAQIEPAFHAADVSDIPIENIRPDAIKIDGIKGLGERPTAKWVRRVVMALLGLAGATAAAAWQHYGDQAKAMAVEWAPPFVIAALAPAEKSAAAEQPNVTAVRAAAADQAAPTDQPAAQPVATAQPEQAAAAAATATPAESTQLQSMARDLAAMSQQVEELKASIAQLKAGQTQMSRETAKAAEPRTSETRPGENVRPRVTAAAPPPRPTAAPVRRPMPAYPPAQAAYVPPLPPVPAPVQSQPAPPPQQTIADDGEPIVRPPMPVR